MSQCPTFRPSQIRALHFLELLPHLKFEFQMLLQLRELVSKVLTTSPTCHFALQISLPSWMPSRIVCRQREIVHVYQKRRIKAVVMLPVPHAWAYSVF